MTDNKSQNHKGSPLFRNIVVGTILAVVMLLVAVVAMVAMAGTTIINQKNLLQWSGTLKQKVKQI